jgi:Eco57I restriction-modification methylase/TaqI-like C-terminal specificity domain
LNMKTAPFTYRSQRSVKFLLITFLGVDIDHQAVEVAQLALYLKLLEEETTATARGYQLEFHETLLPPLNKNIICGNSLVDADILEGSLFDSHEERRMNPMNFVDRFPDIMKKGGFDVIIGNPPYIRIQTLQETNPRAAEYLARHYQSASKGNYDIYVAFVERGLDLLGKEGRASWILPHKFFNAKYGQPLREKLSRGHHVSQIVHFGHHQVFKGPTTYTCLLFLTKQRSPACKFVKVEDIDAWASKSEGIENEVSASKIGSGYWTFTSGSSAALLERLLSFPCNLEQATSRIFQGIKTSADKIYIVEERSREGNRVKVFSPQLNRDDIWLEKDLLHPLIKGGDSRAFQLVPTDRLILFPYAVGEDESNYLIPQKELKAEYPLTWEYLTNNKEYLSAREHGRFKGPEWYQYGRSQALDVIALPKIFTPDLAAHVSFSIDETGDYFFTGGVAGGYGLLFREGFTAKYCLGLLNSRLMEWIISRTTTQMRGGYYSFEARFIRNLPIRRIDFSNSEDKKRHDRMVDLVSSITEAKKRLRGSITDRDISYYESRCVSIMRNIDTLVYELYGLSDEEIQNVEGLDERE